MHRLGRALADRGVAIYAPDLRGHGSSGELGQIVYRGQYEDDLADLAALIARAHPAERRLLVGHSSGGSLALRMAGGAAAGSYDGYLALAPFVTPDPPLSRPGQGGWTEVSVPRIVALSLLNQLGIDRFDRLAVLAMAVPADAEPGRPRRYSHALLASLNLPRDWSGALSRIRHPTVVLIGEADELFVASEYPAGISAANPRIAVGLLPGAGHMDWLYDPSAIDLAVAAAQRLLGEDSDKPPVEAARPRANIPAGAGGPP
jgi:pimeloyl-ACP methyl ester carboxylesterase